MSTIREILLDLPILDIDHILDRYLLPYITTNIDLALTDFISNIKVIESPSNAQLILLEKNKLTKLTTPMCLEEIINVLRYEYDTLAVETIPQLNRIQECFRGIHVEKLSPEVLNTLSSDYRAWYTKYGSTFRDWYTKYGDISLTFRGAKPRLFTATTSLPHLNIIDTNKRNDRNLKLSITSMNSRKRVSNLFFSFLLFFLYIYIFFLHRNFKVIFALPNGNCWQTVIISEIKLLLLNS
jgi:hypothetical protein